MRTYGDVVDDLARSAALLVATAAPVEHPEHLIVARNAIHDGIRHTVDALVAARVRPTRPRIADLQLDPAGAFRSALHLLPRVPGSLGLAEVAATRVLPGAWIDGAAAALELTKYEESFGGLHPLARWAPLGDLADITTTFVQVDMELRRALPGIGLPGTRPLVEVQIAAAATIHEASTRGGDRAAQRLPEPIPAQPWPVRRAADIPVAVDRIAAMIQARGSSITMQEFGAVAVNMAQSLDEAGKILRISAAHVEEPDAWLELAGHAEATRNALAGLARHRNQVMTVGPIEASLIRQALELRGGMRSLLVHSEDTDGAFNLGAGRVSIALASQSRAVMQALEHALVNAADAGQLLVRSRDTRLLQRHWVVARPDDDRLASLMLALAMTASVTSSRESGRGSAGLAPVARESVKTEAMSHREDIVAITCTSRPEGPLLESAAQLD